MNIFQLAAWNTGLDIVLVPLFAWAFIVGIIIGGIGMLAYLKVR